MLAGNTSMLLETYRRGTGDKVCGECGGKMSEVERRNENSALFIWYACNRAGCNGQWLEKARY